jgi:hypothetical protein
MIGIPLLLLAVGGLGCLVFAGGMFAARRFVDAQTVHPFLDTPP